MILSTTEKIAGYEITEVLGIVKGSAVRARHIGKDIVALFRNLFGGEVLEYTELINKTRELAFTRLIDDANKLNADAIINLRFSSTQVMQGVAEILVYGTAVKLKKS